MRIEDAVTDVIEHAARAVGFERLMELVEQCWAASVRETGRSDTNRTVGPRACALVPCPHAESISCEWCCNTGRVTRRVYQAMKAA
jgi:hypothetical protein